MSLRKYFQFLFFIVFAFTTLLPNADAEHHRHRPAAKKLDHPIFIREGYADNSGHLILVTFDRSMRSLPKDANISVRTDLYWGTFDELFQLDETGPAEQVAPPVQRSKTGPFYQRGFFEPRLGKKWDQTGELDYSESSGNMLITCGESSTSFRRLHTEERKILSDKINKTQTMVLRPLLLEHRISYRLFKFPDKDEYLYLYPNDDDTTNENEPLKLFHLYPHPLERIDLTKYYAIATKNDGFKLTPMDSSKPIEVFGSSLEKEKAGPAKSYTARELKLKERSIYKRLNGSLGVVSNLSGKYVYRLNEADEYFELDTAFMHRIIIGGKYKEGLVTFSPTFSVYRILPAQVEPIKVVKTETLEEGSDNETQQFTLRPNENGQQSILTVYSPNKADLPNAASLLTLPDANPIYLELPSGVNNADLGIDPASEEGAEMPTPCDLFPQELTSVPNNKI